MFRFACHGMGNYTKINWTVCYSLALFFFFWKGFSTQLDYRYSQHVIFWRMDTCNCDVYSSKKKCDVYVWHREIIHKKITNWTMLVAISYECGHSMRKYQNFCSTLQPYNFYHNSCVTFITTLVWSIVSGGKKKVIETYERWLSTIHI